MARSLVYVFVVCALVVVSVFNHQANAQSSIRLLANITRDAVSNITTQNLGTTAMKNVLLNQLLTTTKVPSVQAVSNLAAAVSGRLRTYGARARVLRLEIEGRYGDPRSINSQITFNDADDPNLASKLNLTYSSRFNTEVSTSATVVKLADNVKAEFASPNADQLLALFASDNLVTLMRNNLNDLSALKFQYFAAEEGFVRYYPAARWPTDSSGNPLPYDARTLGWYSRSATSSKAVVVLMDISSKASNPQYDASVAAVNALLNALSPVDFVYILPYAEKVVHPTCPDIANELIRVSEQNKGYLQDFLSSLPDLSDKDPDHKKAFKEAKKVIEFTRRNDNKPVRCVTSILWITPDESAFDHDMEEEIKDMNSDLNAQINIYSLSKGHNQFQQRISCSSSGLYARVTNEELPYNVSRFYTLYTTTAPVDPQNTPDQYDVTLGLREDLNFGQLVVLTQPVYVPLGAGVFKFIGVVGLEFSLNDLQPLFDGVAIGQTFGMMIKQTGDTILHPYLPPPAAADTVAFLDIRDVETTPGFYNIRTGMVDQTSGDRQTVAIRPVFEGGTATLSTNYVWTFVDESPFSVAIAFALADLTQKTYLPAPGWVTAVYARADLYPPGLLPYNLTFSRDSLHGPVTITYDAPTFLGAPSEWVDSVTWLTTPETNTTVAALHKFVNSQPAARNPGIIESFKNSVQISSNIAPTWLSNTTAFAGVVWRYIGWVDGTFYVYPGRVGDYRGFDPRLTRWYARAAQSFPNQVTLSTPYVDQVAPLPGETVGHLGSGQSIVTIARGLYDDTNAVLAAVMGIDIQYAAFHLSLASTLGCAITSSDPTLPQCTLINSNGNLIMHVDFLENGPPPASQPYVFFGTKHRGIASALIQSGAFKLQNHTDYRSQTIVPVYAPNDFVLGKNPVQSGSVNDGCESGDWEFTRVSGVNAYLIVIRNYARAPSCTAPPVLPPSPLPYVYDVCHENYLDARFPITAGECPMYNLDNKKGLDALREQGAKCEGLGKYRETIWIEFSDPVGVFITVMTSICLALLVVMFVFLFINRDEPIIRGASPLFCYLMFVGAALGYISVYFFTGEPNDALCVLRPWFLTLGYVILFGNLMAKTWRIWRLFEQAKSLKRQAIPPSKLLKITGAMLGFMCLLLILWCAIDTPTARTISDAYDDSKEYKTCRSDYHFVWVGLILGYLGLFLVGGVFLSFRTRNVATAFNESKWIALSMYNIFFVAIICLPIIYGLQHFPDVSYVITGIGILLVFTTTMCLIFLPKFYILLFAKEQNTLDTSTTNTAGGTRDTSTDRDNVTSFSA